MLLALWSLWESQAPPPPPFIPSAAGVAVIYFNMRPENPTEQYEAVVYTTKGVHAQCYFDDLRLAHQWIAKEYERLRKMDVECAYEIYDYKPNKTRIFVSDEWFLLSEQSAS